MKKKKLKLGELKVQSFVTSLEEVDNETIKGLGGSGHTALICSATITFTATILASLLLCGNRTGIPCQTPNPQTPFAPTGYRAGCGGGPRGGGRAILEDTECLPDVENCV